MASEISYAMALQCVNGSFRHVRNLGALTADQSAQGGGGPGTIEVATSDTTIPLANLETPGWCWIRNLDDENCVEFGPDSGGVMVTFGKLKPGECALFRLAPTTAFKAKANTAPCKMQVEILED